MRVGACYSSDFILICASWIEKIGAGSAIISTVYFQQTIGVWNYKRFTKVKSCSTKCKESINYWKVDVTVIGMVGLRRRIGAIYRQPGVASER